MAKMPNHKAFAREHGDLDRFLFAEIGGEASGMRLSVVSAIARLDRDPRIEARRWAGLSRQAAIDDLTPIIAALPPVTFATEDARAIAVRLVSLLPGATSPGAVQPASGLDWLAATTRRARSTDRS